MPSKCLRRFSLLLCWLVLASYACHAQRWVDTTIKPIVPYYGYHPGEFAIFATPSKWLGSADSIANIGQFGDLWYLAHDLGFNIMHVGGGQSLLDGLVGSSARIHGTLSHPEDDKDRIVYSDGLKKGEGRGWAAKFYPFDSTESPFNIWKFATIAGGDSAFNSVELNSERHYTSSNTTAGQIILQNLYYRYPYDTTQTVPFFDRGWNFWRRDQMMLGADSSFTFVVKGHLLTPVDSAVSSSAVVFTVKIFHSIFAGQWHRNSNSSPPLFDTATTNSLILIDTFNVTKGQLAKDTLQPLAAYRTIEHTITNMRVRPIDNGPGPLCDLSPQYGWQPGADQGRVEVQIVWAGAANAAIRDFEMRDVWAQTKLGQDSASVAQRVAILAGLRSLLRGSSSTTRLDSLRHCIIALEIGAEPGPNLYDFEGWEAMNNLISDTFNLAHQRTPQVGDSLKGYVWSFWSPAFQHYASSPSMIFEYGPFNNPCNIDTNYFDGDPSHGMNVWLEAPYHQIPSLEEHNGGRFHIPTLVVADTAIQSYETTLQRYMGYYDPNLTAPADIHFREIGGLGRMATDARREGKRLIPMIEPYVTFNLREKLHHPAADSLDTIASHIPEAAELRMEANVALAYGAAGIWWENLLMNPGILRQSDSTHRWLTITPSGDNDNCCWGATGYLTRDTMADRVTLPLYHVDSNSYARATVHNIYLGWQTHEREIKWLNTKWLNNLGPASDLVKLRWRDSYSIHHTAKWDGWSDHFYRPLPSNEIITQITTRPIGSTHNDTTFRTFVELGLFYTHPGKDSTFAERMKDTNWCYLVNRRTFERPRDDTADTPENRKMDTLAEARIVHVRFNLAHPLEDSLGHRQYTFIHVQEMHGDSTPLPLTTAKRKPLDTLVRADSAIEIAMRPGGGALLRITYAPYDESIIAGDLRFNGQRKLVWANNHYYAAYWRRELVGGVWHSNVYLRRSQAMPDSMPAGSILWEPEIDQPLNDVRFGMGSPPLEQDTARLNNCFPSLTFRCLSKDSTLLSVIWTCHSSVGAPIYKREVVRRNIMDWDGHGYIWGHLEFVNEHFGWDSTQWGTPVISALATSDMMLFSDSLSGIEAQARSVGTGTDHWLKKNGGTYSAANVVSNGTPFAGVGSKHPSVVTSPLPWQTSTGAVWQQQFTLYGRDIVYRRVFDTSATFGPTAGNQLGVGIAAEWNSYPAIDQARDTMLGKIREGITWEADRTTTLKAGSMSFLYHTGIINFARAETPVIVATTKGKTDTTLGVTSDMAIGAYESGWQALWGTPVLPPSIAAINDNMDTANHSTPTFSIAWGLGSQPTCLGCEPRQNMVNARVRWATGRFDSTVNAYSYAGINPSTSASNRNLFNRMAILYQAIIGMTPSTSGDTLRTSREFFAKARPIGYIASGRQAAFRTDTLKSGVIAMLHDVWVADTNGGSAVPMVERGASGLCVNSQPSLDSLLRSTYFHAHDSTLVGAEVYCGYVGDTSSLGSSRFHFSTELVDSATNSVVKTLDTFSIVTPLDTHHIVLNPQYDLLSGTYYVRLKITPTGFTPATIPGTCLYPVQEMASLVTDTTVFSKLRREGKNVAGVARISAQPNPFSKHSEIRFSIPVPDYVSVTVYGQNGERIVELLSKTWVEAGRFALELDGSTLSPGSYIVEMRYGTRSIASKLILMR